MATDREIRERAEELYVINGLTLDEVSEETGVPARTIQKWSADDGWKARQKEYRNASAEIRRYTRLTKLKLIKDAMTSLDPQKIYAFAALERATSEKPGTGDQTSELSQENADIEIKTPQDAINALQEAIEIKLKILLAKPEALNLSAIKNLKQAMELVDGMKAKYGAEDQEEERIEGYDEDQARFWREKFLKGR